TWLEQRRLLRAGDDAVVVVLHHHVTEERLDDTHLLTHLLEPTAHVGGTGCLRDLRSIASIALDEGALFQGHHTALPFSASLSCAWSFMCSLRVITIRFSGRLSVLSPLMWWTTSSSRSGRPIICSATNLCSA